LASESFLSFLNLLNIFCILSVIAFLVEIPPPLREDINNIILLGLWHGPVAPSSSLLLGKVVENIKLVNVTGVNIFINNRKSLFQ